MASKRKQKDMKQDTPFELTDFDEREYLREQIGVGKGVFVSVAWAIIIGALTFFTLTLFMDPWQIIFVPGIIGLGALYLILPRFKVDLNAMNKKSWLNFVFAFGLTWLAVVIIAMNPPFSDLAEPIIESRTLRIQEHNATVDTVGITVMIRDNYRLDEERLTLTFPDGTGVTPPVQEYDLENDGGSLYTFYLSRDTVERIIERQGNRSSGFVIGYEIRAVDGRGNEERYFGDFRIVGENRPPTLRGENNPSHNAEGQSIDFHINDNSEFREVYFTVNRKNGELVKDEVRYEFSHPENFQLIEDGGEHLFEYTFSLGDFRKGSYNITITAVDAGNNTIRTDMEFTMEADGADVGKGGKKGLLPGFGVTYGISALIAVLAVMVVGRRFNRGR